MFTGPHYAILAYLNKKNRLNLLEQFKIENVALIGWPTKVKYILIKEKLSSLSGLFRASFYIS
jgi:hypothetical protein